MYKKCRWRSSFPYYIVLVTCRLSIKKSIKSQKEFLIYAFFRRVKQNRFAPFFRRLFNVSHSFQRDETLFQLVRISRNLCVAIGESGRPVMVSYNRRHWSLNGFWGFIRIHSVFNQGIPGSDLASFQVATDNALPRKILQKKWTALDTCWYIMRIKNLPFGTGDKKTVFVHR